MTGVAVGSGIGSLEEIQAAAALLAQPRGHRRISPFFVTRLLINMAAGHISMTHNLRGPNVRSRAVVAALHSLSHCSVVAAHIHSPPRLRAAPAQSHNAVPLAAPRCPCTRSHTWAAPHNASNRWRQKSNHTHQPTKCRQTPLPMLRSVTISTPWSLFPCSLAPSYGTRSLSIVALLSSSLLLPSNHVFSTPA